MKRKAKTYFTLPAGKQGQEAIALTFKLKAEIEHLGGIPKHPEPWEDDLPVYNNALLEQLEDLRKEKGIEK